MRIVRAKSIRSFVFTKAPTVTKQTFKKQDEPVVIKQYKNARGELVQKVQHRTNAYRAGYRRLKMIFNAIPRDQRGNGVLERIMDAISRVQSVKQV